MQQTIKENTNTLGKNAMTYGAITGFALVLISLLFYSSNLQNSGYLNFITYLILGAGVYIGTKNFRDKSLGGYMNYSKSVGSGALICLFSSFILAFYFYILYKVIDPNGIQVLIQTMEENLINQGMPDEQIEMFLEILNKTMTPGIIAFGYVFSITFYGTILSLILSFFIKKVKTQKPFDKAMNEIEN
ncbi:MAG: hypothetical protein DRJ01_11780 [Bacteroidetes bacterium]|nr:MAG: hypothetical protein DRJ01_11780 [Bacteroidota bacterium]